MEPVLSFLNMGGHAAFVWPALSLTAAVLVAMLVISVHTLRREERILRQLEDRRGGRANRRRRA